MDVLRIHYFCGVSDDFPKRAAIGTNDRCSAGHGFDWREAETFVERWIDESIRGAIEVWDIFITHEAERLNVGGERRGFDAGVNGFGPVPVAAAENKLPIGFAAGFELVKSINQAGVIFARVFQARDIKKKGLSDSRSAGELELRASAIARKEAVVLQAIIDHRKFRAWYSKERFDVARGVFADGNNFVLATGEIFYHDPAIDHARQVIFARNTKGSQVMDSRDFRARPRKNHPAIAWNVENIEFMLIYEVGKQG